MQDKRGLLWWLSAVLAPLGVVGGPLAIADMFSGLIEWKGWVAYSLAFWDRYVSEPFGIILQYAALNLRLPKPPEALVDYLALGVLLMSGFVRSATLIERSERGNLSDGMVAVLVAIFCVFGLVLWPLMLIVWAGRFVVFGWDAISEPEVREGALANVRYMGLLLAPFVLFLLLFALNAFGLT